MSIARTLIKLEQSTAVSSFLCVAVLLLASVPQTQAAFSTPTPLTSTLTDSSDQQVATSGNNVYVAWRDTEQISATASSPEIYFARSTNGGLTFEAPQNISQSPTIPGTGSPRIAASGQHVYIAFNDGANSFLAHSEDGGVSFLPKTNLADFGVYIGPSGWLAASGSNLYMVFRQLTGGADDIHMARFGSYSTSFLGLQNVSASPAHSIDPVVTATGNSVYVAWSEPVTGNSNDILFRRSTDGGVAFDAVKNVSNNTGLSRFPTMTADGTKIWLAWTDKTPLNDDIFLARSVDSGNLFESTLNLTNNATNSMDPTVTAKGSSVYVAWSELPAGGTGNLRDIFLATSADSGASFDPASTKNVSETASALSAVPRVAATDAVLSVYWGESLQAGIGTQRDIFFSSQELSVPVPPPSMLSLTPGAGMQTQSVDVDLTGSGFQSGATLALSGTGVTVTDVVPVSPTAMKAKMHVALTATPGGRDLTVTNPDGKSATLSGAFTVMSASVLMLIDIARTDVNIGAGNGGFLTASSNGKDDANSSYKSLLAHLDNAEKALLQQPPDAAIAINQMDAFYIKIGNLAKGKKPEITPALYTTLYNDYAMVMGSLGGTVKPAQ